MSPTTPVSKKGASGLMLVSLTFLSFFLFFMFTFRCKMLFNWLFSTHFAHYVPNLSQIVAGIFPCLIHSDLSVRFLSLLSVLFGIC